MIRFFDDADKHLFLAEVGKDINEDDEPKDHSLFVKARSLILPALKNFRRSQASKSAWRGNKSSYNFGIRRWHRSAEGRRFHRNLGRFLSTKPGRDRVSLLREDFTELPLTVSEKKELLAELIVESTYYHSLIDQADLELVIEEISADL